ncbi:hypothetical protein GOHSU_20_00180 [Gordonia hirsuta DSM 44140 = NBRC 16056]|uniref:DUF4185 domain-containing protein n=1 Tax=Gordonia hirsuta DSM 44140 = NBRC 16056 TaxID=1121927 RepID=L7L9T3_9ACTN|nr:DUF4185 domain-containing protein [Gordonia hirsuta]GAC57481.1 hypothetical protein GOHSU_20_00180 [Gordonia hirsuta DSM 44140 = NBRC 16056]
MPTRRATGRPAVRVRSAALIAAVTLTAGLVSITGPGVAGQAGAAACSNSGSGLQTLLPAPLGRPARPHGPQRAMPRYDDGRSKTIAWVTGPKSPNRTYSRHGISGTDIGVAWDNGRGETLMAFGDTFGNCAEAGQQWRHNVLMRTTDRNYADGLTVRSAGGWAPTMIGALGMRFVEVTTIPTAGIAINGKQYINYMSVRAWGVPGEWATNYAGIAVSGDNGRTWQTNPANFRWNIAGNSNFQQSAYVRGTGPDAGWIFQYGTPNGRSGAAHVARFRPADILNLGAYEYWNGHGWVRDVNASRPVVRRPVSELSVAYSQYLRKYVMLHTTSGVVLRTAKRPQGPWSPPRMLLRKGTVDAYAPMILPHSPALTGAGPELYYNGSRWDDYNVLLIRTNLR